MKKFLAVCLSAALAASMLVGCGGNNEKVTAKVIDIDLTNEEYAFGVDKEQPELLDEVNDFIASIKEDGFFEMRDKPITKFEESAFESIVERIVVINQHELEFHLIGGLKFKEKIK